MAQGDRTKWDYILNLNIVEFLNTVAYMKDKQAHEQLQLERMKRG